MSNAKHTNSKITALYERLSVDDGTTDESNSIQTQKAMLEQYAQAHGLTNIRHYTDEKSEAKRWEGNYNNLYRQHVQLKRSKGLEIE